MLGHKWAHKFSSTSTPGFLRECKYYLPYMTCPIICILTPIMTFCYLSYNCLRDPICHFFINLGQFLKLGAKKNLTYAILGILETIVQQASVSSSLFFQASKTFWPSFYFLQPDPKKAIFSSLCRQKCLPTNMDWECKKVSNFLENSFCLSQFFDWDFVYLFLLKLRYTQV